MVIKNLYLVPGTRSGHSESGSKTLVVVKSDNQSFGSALVLRPIQHYRYVSMRIQSLSLSAFVTGIYTVHRKIQTNRTNTVLYSKK
jgi:hypothetical protein